jgi:hypothetical protein
MNCILICSSPRGQLDVDVGKIKYCFASHKRRPRPTIPSVPIFSIFLTHRPWLILNTSPLQPIPSLPALRTTRKNRTLVPISPLTVNTMRRPSVKVQTNGGRRSVFHCRPSAAQADVRRARRPPETLSIGIVISRPFALVASRPGMSFGSPRAVSTPHTTASTDGPTPTPIRLVPPSPFVFILASPVGQSTILGVYLLRVPLIVNLLSLDLSHPDRVLTENFF